MAAKTKAFLIETVGVQSFKKGNTLLPKEKKWLGTYTFRDRKKDPRKASINPWWWLRDMDVEFQIWWKAQWKASIFFDGASKGNLGRAGAGGVVYSMDVKRVYSFSWGLGQKTNNHIEILGLFKAC